MVSCRCFSFMKLIFIVNFLTTIHISLIATPGRLLHLIVEMDLDLKSVQYIVFDEADR